MRHWLVLFVGSTLSLSAMDARTWVDVTADYRSDSVDWSFEAPSPDPLIGSTLRFKDIQIFEIGFDARTVLDCNALIRASADFGWIIDGDVSETLTHFRDDVDDEDEIDDSDRLRASHILDGRYVADLSLALGYPLYFCDCTVSIAPVVGYAYNSQSFAEDRNDEIEFIPLGTEIPSVGLHFEEDEDSDNKYVSRFYGPFIGVDFNYNPNDCLGIYAQFEYHFAHWKGKRDSSVDFDEFDDFDSGTHHAHGVVVNVGVDYLLCDCWFVGLNATYQEWHAHKSQDISDALADEHFAPEPPTGTCACDKMSVRLNTHSMAVGVSVGKKF